MDLCERHIIVTGPESSGGSLVARTIAHVLGVSHYNDWSGMDPHTVSDKYLKVQHTSLPASRPAVFADVQKWIYGDGGDVHISFVLTVRDNGISIRSKMRRAEMALDEAENHNVRAAQLMAEIAASHRPHLFFSYESLIFLGSAYLKELYRFLGVDSDFVPPLIDANTRYLKPPLQEGGPRETARPTL